MISTEQSRAGTFAHSVFIGSDPEFRADSFTGQYEILLQKLTGLSILAYAEQVHGDLAFEIRQEKPGLICAGEGDALWTRQKNTGLLIRTADCVPILFYSKSESLVGAVHAGWRGLEKKILTKTLSATGNPVQDFEFVVGPFIREQSYEVGSDVADRFEVVFAAPKGNGKYDLNLKGILEAEFRTLGIAEDRVSWHAEDTRSSTAWYSARRGDANRNLSVIWLSPRS